VKKSNTVKSVKFFLYTILLLLLTGSVINCGGGNSSAPAQVNAPKILIQDFIAKHQVMVDKTLVEFYVTEEQPLIAVAVQKAIDEKSATGDLQKLQQATFDFSNLQIAVIGEKEEYINDEPKKIIQVSVSGSYIMAQAEEKKTIPADSTIVLQLVGNAWKVTEKIQPWS
jgi:hypothetical protein